MERCPVPQISSTPRPSLKSIPKGYTHARASWSGGRLVLLMKSVAQQRRVVAAIKLLHTVVWLFLVACILAVPVAGSVHNFQACCGLRNHCPVGVSSPRHQSMPLPAQRSGRPLHAEVTPNFDIYLPNWLARHNKLIFGILFVAGGLLTFASGWPSFPH